MYVLASLLEARAYAEKVKAERLFILIYLMMIILNQKLLTTKMTQSYSDCPENNGKYKYFLVLKLLWFFFALSFIFNFIHFMCIFHLF